MMNPKKRHFRKRPDTDVAFVIDDAAQAYAEEFIAEATSAEYAAQEGRRDAIEEETRDRFIREMSMLDQA